MTGIMWWPRNLPIFFAGRLRKRSRLSLTSRIPTVICVGRRLAIETGFKIGSRSVTMTGSLRILAGVVRPPAGPASVNRFLKRAAKNQDEEDQWHAQHNDPPLADTASCADARGQPGT